MPLQRTLALVKPDACGQPWYDIVMKRPEEQEDADEEEAAQLPKWVETKELRAADKATEILKRIEQAGFTIVDQKLMRLSIEQAQEFYAEHAGKSFFETLTTFMSSGPILALQLEREDAIAEWRALMGPTNTFKAQDAAAAEHPVNEENWPLRALFGTDGTRNATHGSDAPWTAMRELEFYFPTTAPWQRAVVAITPDAMEAQSADAIQARLEDAGLWVVHSTDVKLTPEAAAALNACGGVGLDASDAAVKAACSGTSRVLVVEGVKAVRRVQVLAGPPSVEKAKDCSPASLRAQFGSSDSKLAVLVAGSAAAAEAGIAAALGADGVPLERTLAVIKPQTSERHYAAIVREIVQHGFMILAEQRTTVPRERVEDFYGEHKGKFFFNRLVSYISSGPVVALVLAKASAIKCWRTLMGPTNTFTAQRDAPESLRAKYGIDGTRNATHGSDSAESAAREIKFYFPSFASAAPLQGAAADDYIHKHALAKGYAVGRGEVDETLHTVLTRGLVELCKAKPQGSHAVQWLGQWLHQHNPRTGFAAEPGAATGAGASLPPGAAVTVLEAEEGALESKYDDLPLAEEVLDGEDGSGAQESKHSADSAGGAAEALPADSSIVFVLGGPGSGKGTQCERLRDTFGYTHLSTGDLLRAEVASGSEFGASLEATMKSGGLVTTATVLELLKKNMLSSGSTKFLIDGFPRAVDQAFEFEAVFGPPSFVLEFSAEEETLVQRLVARGKASGRADDNEDTIRSRLQTFKEESQPVLDFYSKLGVVRSISSEGRSVDEVFQAASKCFHAHLVSVIGAPGGPVDAVLQRMHSEAEYVILREADLVDAEIERNTPLGQQLAGAVEVGDNIPTDTLVMLMQQHIARKPHAKYALANFPRTKASAKALEGAVGPPTLILHTEGPPKAPKGAKGVAREDYERACRIYKNGTAAMLQVYRCQGLVRDLPQRSSVDSTWKAAREALTPEVVFVLGGPGSGKGTQCANIVQRYGYTHLSAGDLLRAEVARGSPDGQMIDACIAEGRLVPQEVTVSLLQTAMTKSGNSKFLIDGFPRAMDQAEAFEALIGPPSFVLFFDCPEEEMRKRLLSRGQTSGRVDDNEDAIVKRFHTFVQSSMPVIDYYARQGRVQSVDATPSSEEVFTAVKAIFDPVVAFVLGGPGSGKGTQCANIVSNYGYTHLSAGDLLRAEKARGSPQGQMIEGHMRAGTLVPQEVTIRLLQAAMENSGAKKFLIDGFPRAMDQAEAFEALIGPPSFVLFFDCPEEEMRKRLLSRGQTSGRVDDNEDAIVKRFRTFQERSLPVVGHYEKMSLVHRISAVPPPSVVFQQVRKAFTTDVVVLLGAAGSGRGEFMMRAGRALGYAPIRVTALLQEEAANADSPYAADVKLAFATKRTAPIEATIAVIRRAMAASTAKRFILDGYPRVVSVGYPRVSDQVFALEEAVGPIKGAVLLETEDSARSSRVSGGQAMSVGEAAALRASIDTFHREKMPVAQYFERLHKLVPVSTAQGPEAVFDAALPFLEADPVVSAKQGRTTAMGAVAHTL